MQEESAEGEGERKKKREEDSSSCLHISHLTKRLDNRIAGLLVDMQCLTMMYDDYPDEPSLLTEGQTDRKARWKYTLPICS